MSSLYYRHRMKNELKKQIKYTHITHIRPVLKVRHRISHLSMVQLEFCEHMLYLIITSNLDLSDFKSEDCLKV